MAFRITLGLLITLWSTYGWALGADPQKTTMLGTDKALECPLTGSPVCEREDLSDTSISTTRASTRMCQDALGNWTTKGVNEPCFGAVGGAPKVVTNYATNSAELAGFQSRNGATIVASPTGDGFRVTDNNTSDFGGVDSAGSVTGLAGETYTLTCEAKYVSGSTTLYMFMGGGASTCSHTLTSNFERYSCTGTLTGAATMRGRCWVGPLTTDTGSFDLRQLQLEKSPSAGPRVDCGASACSESFPASVGLASFGAGTNYSPNSADPSLWAQVGTPIVTAVSGGYRMRDDNASGTEGLRTGASIATTVGENITASCILRLSTDAATASTHARIYVDGTSFCDVPLTANWTRHSCTKATSTGSTLGTLYAVGSGGILSADTLSLEVQQCQTEKSPTPGTRHDCAGAACSWAADVHTVDASGWPTSTFDLRLQYAPNGWPVQTRILLNTSSVVLYVGASGTAILSVNGSTVASFAATEAMRNYTARFNGTTWTFCGEATCSSAAGPAPNPHGTAYLGSNSSGANNANGHIRLVRVSQ